MKVFWILTLAVWVFLSGCTQVTAPAEAVEPSSSPTQADIPLTAAQPDLTDATATFTPQPCGYMWATQELPDISKDLGQALADAGIEAVEARAAAYGENCIGEDQQVQKFLAMQTDFYFTIPVEDAADVASMGKWVGKIMPVLDQFPPGKVPGPNPGYVGMRFVSSDGEKNLWFQQQAARELLQQELPPGELFDALSNR